MKSKKMMWAAYVCMTQNMWDDYKKPWCLEDKAWDETLMHLSAKGYNTVVLDIGDGLIWKSHPEIALSGAWSHERMKAEVKKAKDLGLTVLPKLNFSTLHDCWLGVYDRMVATPVYYGVCRDLINEICELFDTPEYVHLGMDEENYKMTSRYHFACYRQHDLMWHDLKFLCDCVSQNGSTPWIWADIMQNYPEGFREHFRPDEILLSPWQYFALYEEHFNPITRTPEDYKCYTTGIWKNCGFTYIEEDPHCVTYRQEVIPAMNDGFKVVPTTSFCFRCEWNHDDTLRWFKEKAPQDKIIGFMDAPWEQTTMACLDKIKTSTNALMTAKDKYYK